jgi:hypothetical protein
MTCCSQQERRPRVGGKETRSREYEKKYFGNREKKREIPLSSTMRLAVSKLPLSNPEGQSLRAQPRTTPRFPPTCFLATGDHLDLLRCMRSIPENQHLTLPPTQQPLGDERCSAPHTLDLPEETFTVLRSPSGQTAYWPNAHTSLCIGRETSDGDRGESVADERDGHEGIAENLSELCQSKGKIEFELSQRRVDAPRDTSRKDTPGW